MKDLRGFLIRYYRLQKNFSQEGLCHGICAVSYLSKIEQGRVVAADEIYQALFQALGISFQADGLWIAQARGMLQEHMEELLHSPLCVDVLLIKALYEKQEAEKLLQELAVFLD